MRSGPALGLVVVLLGWGTALAEEPPSLRVSLEAGRLSVAARDVPLHRVLSEIGRRSGAAIYVEATVEPELTAASTSLVFEARPLEEGLRLLLRERHFVLVYSADGLAEIRVYGDGTGEFRRLAGGTETRRAERRAAKAARKAAATPERQALREAVRSAEQSADLSQGIPQDGPLADLAPFRAQALTDPDPMRRTTGLYEMVKRGSQRLVAETALEMLDRERDPELLQIALDLVSAQESVPLDPIVRLARSEAAPAVRIEALNVLAIEGGGEDARVTELLGHLAKNDKDSGVRRAAQRLLQDLEGEPAKEPVTGDRRRH